MCSSLNYVASRDRRLSPRLKWILPPSGLLEGVRWFKTDVLGLLSALSSSVKLYFLALLLPGQLDHWTWTSSFETSVLNHLRRRNNPKRRKNTLLNSWCFSVYVCNVGGKLRNVFYFVSVVAQTSHIYVGGCVKDAVSRILLVFRPVHHSAGSRGVNVGRQLYEINSQSIVSYSCSCCFGSRYCEVIPLSVITGVSVY